MSKRSKVDAPESSILASNFWLIALGIVLVAVMAGNVLLLLNAVYGIF